VIGGLDRVSLRIAVGVLDRQACLFCRAAHEVGEKWLGIFVGATRQRARDCVVAPASVESLHVDLLS